MSIKDLFLLKPIQIPGKLKHNYTYSIYKNRRKEFFFDGKVSNENGFSMTRDGEGRGGIQIIQFVKFQITVRRKQGVVFSRLFQEENNVLTAQSFGKI